jgi:iron complex transport system substrate-binding protein
MTTRQSWAGLSCVLALALSATAAGAAPVAAPALAPPLPARPARIVALGLPADELALALVPSTRIAALDRFADDPEASNVVDEARTVRARVPVSAEAIAAQSPDLVLVPAWASPDLEAMLHRFDIATLRVPTPRSLDALREAIRIVAAALDARAQGETLVAELDRSLEETRRSVAGLPRPTALLDAGSGYSPGGGTLLSDLVEAAGGHLLLATRGEQGLVPLSIERELSLDPDVLLVDRYRADAHARVLGEPERALDPRLAHLRAAREGRVRVLPARLLLSTTHHVAHTARALAEALHASPSMPPRLVGDRP